MPLTSLPIGAIRCRSSTSTVSETFASTLLVFERRLFGNETLEAREARFIKTTVVDRFTHRTAWLAVVFAVTKTAVIHEIEDVNEGPLNAVPRQPQADGAKAGCVDQPPAFWKRQ